MQIFFFMFKEARGGVEQMLKASQLLCFLDTITDLWKSCPVAAFRCWTQLYIFTPAMCHKMGFQGMIFVSLTLILISFNNFFEALRFSWKLWYCSEKANVGSNNTSKLLSNGDLCYGSGTLPNLFLTERVHSHYVIKCHYVQIVVRYSSLTSFHSLLAEFSSKVSTG